MAFSAVPEQKNTTPFSVEPAFLADENGDSLFVPIIKGTFRIDGTDSLVLSEEQIPVDLAGTYWGDAEKSSYRYEPECAFFKPATDVVLNGHAYPSEQGATQTLTGVRVGRLQKTVSVFGDRFWVRDLTVSYTHLEAWRAYEFGAALSQVPRSLLDGYRQCIPAMWIGDVGAASALVGVVVATNAFERKYSKADIALVACMPPNGQAGALVLEKATVT